MLDFCILPRNTSIEYKIKLCNYINIRRVLSYMQTDTDILNSPPKEHT